MKWNLGTFLVAAEPTLARNLFESLKEDMLVRPGSATFRYTIRMPPLLPYGTTIQDETIFARMPD